MTIETYKKNRRALLQLCRKDLKNKCRSLSEEQLLTIYSLARNLISGRVHLTNFEKARLRQYKTFLEHLAAASPNLKPSKAFNSKRKILQSCIKKSLCCIQLLCHILDRKISKNLLI